MKTVIVLVSLVAIGLCSSEVNPRHHSVKIKPADEQFIEREKKVLSLLRNFDGHQSEAEYYTIGKNYDIESNKDNYKNKKVVKKFLEIYKHGFLPKLSSFSVFYDKMREEAIALYRLFYSAKDFETLYKTAAFARIHLNSGVFLYAFQVAIVQREDTQDIVFPPAYEVSPEYFANVDVVSKIYYVRTQNNITLNKLDPEYRIIKENNDFIIYANYSNYLNYNNKEQKLSYFTEDIGLNSYYYYFYTQFPFWMNGNHFGVVKELRGEIVYIFYLRLLARYYMERLTNGVGEIPSFSWYTPFKTGYSPFLYNNHPFHQRNDNYFPTEDSYKSLRYLDAYEKKFIKFLENGHFTAYNQEIDFHDEEAIRFVANYWQSNADLYEKTGKHYHFSYQSVARRILGAAPQLTDKNFYKQSALDYYQTSMRDPLFYQLYSRITKYVLQYKQYLKPHNWETLHYAGVKINQVKIDPLVTYFEYFDYDVTDGLFGITEEQIRYKIRQPRLNHKPFTVTIDVKSDAETNAIFKIFLGPKFDSNGYPVALNDNWMNFFELDWFRYKLVPGFNKIERKNDDFLFFEDDRISVTDLYKLFEQGKTPQYKEHPEMPNRLMLPKGTKGGFPFQIFVIAYPQEPLPAKFEPYKDYMKDAKTLGYPFDRPANPINFNQPNMHFEDVDIYHEE